MTGTAHTSYAGFEGRVGRTFAGSDGWWPERREAPAGAPDIIVVLVDDLGFADLGCYGSEIPTPNADRLAASGVRFTDFHSTPMCSPSRAALLTGLDPHRAGFGTVAHLDAGFPGYAMELGDDVVTLPEILRDNGWATLMVGKWHLAKDSDCSAGGPMHSWPLQRGFDRFYGILDAFTNLHQPHRLTSDNSVVEVDEYPDGYYLTDDLTDRAIAMMRERAASRPEQPIFLYVAHGAVHAPLLAKADDIARHAGRYDAGWDALRAERFARQLELGVVAPHTVLPPRNEVRGHEVDAWDDVDDRLKPLLARHMEVYAAMVDNVDQNLGRLLDAQAELGRLDNTIVVVTSDNGASREGEQWGTTAYYGHLLGDDDVDGDLARLDEIGGPTTTPHYPRGWAMASGTPWRLYKINTHRGGHSVPFVMSWPARVADGGSLRHDYCHISDLTPTLLELCDIDHPGERHGRPVQSPTGSSFATHLIDAEATRPGRQQVYEMNGHRGLYDDGWEIVTVHQPLTPFDDSEWELYDLDADPSETRNLAGAHPDRVADLAARWEEAAVDGRIYPLDDGSQVKYLVRPDRVRSFAEPVTIVPGTPTLERWRSVQLVWFRGVEIDCHIEQLPGAAGVLVSHGDQGGGYLLAIEDGRVHYVHNDGHGTYRRLDGGPIDDGDHHVVVRKTAPGGGVWNVAIVVDGNDRGHLDGVPLLFGMRPFEGIDVGIDRRSPVDWSLRERRGPFPYDGRIVSVRYTPGEHAPDSPVNLVDMLREMGRAFE